MSKFQVEVGLVPDDSPDADLEPRVVDVRQSIYLRLGGAGVRWAEVERLLADHVPSGYHIVSYSRVKPDGVNTGFPATTSAHD
jgi:hypothetical protein